MSISLERTATFARPADTTQYGVGELIADTTSAGSVTPLQWSFNTSAGLWLREVRFYKSKVDAVSADFRLWLHSDSSVTFTNGDNGALSISGSTLAISSIAIPIDLPSSTFVTLTGAGSLAFATFDPGLVFLPSTTFGFLEARGTYTPASAESFSIVLRGEPY